MCCLGRVCARTARAVQHAEARPAPGAAGGLRASAAGSQRNPCCVCGRLRPYSALLPSCPFCLHCEAGSGWRATPVAPCGGARCADYVCVTGDPRAPVQGFVAHEPDAARSAAAAPSASAPAASPRLRLQRLWKLRHNHDHGDVRHDHGRVGVQALRQACAHARQTRRRCQPGVAVGGLPSDCRARAARTCARSAAARRRRYSGSGSGAAGWRCRYTA